MYSISSLFYNPIPDVNSSASCLKIKGKKEKISIGIEVALVAASIIVGIAFLTHGFGIKEIYQIGMLSHKTAILCLSVPSGALLIDLLIASVIKSVKKRSALKQVKEEPKENFEDNATKGQIAVNNNSPLIINTTHEEPNDGSHTSNIEENQVIEGNKVLNLVLEEKAETEKDLPSNTEELKQELEKNRLEIEEKIRNIISQKTEAAEYIDSLNDLLNKAQGALNIIDVIVENSVFEKDEKKRSETKEKFKIDRVNEYNNKIDRLSATIKEETQNLETLTKEKNNLEFQLSKINNEIKALSSN